MLRKKISENANIIYIEELPVHRLTNGNPYFESLCRKAAYLTCTAPEFSSLWQEAIGEAWPNEPLVCPPPRSGVPEIEALRQRLRDEIDALVAHLYRLSRADFAHILGTFPLVFPDTPLGQAKKAALLAVYDEFAPITAGWGRE